MLARVHKLFSTTIISGLLVWVNATPLAAESVAEFYKGGSIVIHMGFPGGGFFESAKLVGKHMQKHIPRNPKIVFQVGQEDSARQYLTSWHHLGHSKMVRI